eukprot:TRINITY_DN1359_c0_g1_i1.p1 TRINITY_DN1359_c0_g1~~TRINITY_DN1359_c0_g1_i1.p1  ORF type:complete len:624 (+),score=109.46 TRINITY_DN1359_c0_g1_i1:260-1873(+)
MAQPCKLPQICAKSGFSDSDNELDSDARMRAPSSDTATTTTSADVTSTLSYAAPDSLVTESSAAHAMMTLLQGSPSPPRTTTLTAAGKRQVTSFFFESDQTCEFSNVPRLAVRSVNALAVPIMELWGRQWITWQHACKVTDLTRQYLNYRIINQHDNVEVLRLSCADACRLAEWMRVSAYAAKGDNKCIFFDYALLMEMERVRTGSKYTSQQQRPMTQQVSRNAFRHSYSPDTPRGGGGSKSATRTPIKKMSADLTTALGSDSEFEATRRTRMVVKITIDKRRPRKATRDYDSDTSEDEDLLHPDDIPFEEDSPRTTTPRTPRTTLARARRAFDSASSRKSHHRSPTPERGPRKDIKREQLPPLPARPPFQPHKRTFESVESFSVRKRPASAAELAAQEARRIAREAQAARVSLASAPTVSGVPLQPGQQNLAAPAPLMSTMSTMSTTTTTAFTVTVRSDTSMRLTSPPSASMLNGKHDGQWWSSNDHMANIIPLVQELHENLRSPRSPLGMNVLPSLSDIIAHMSPQPDRPRSSQR